MCPNFKQSGNNNASARVLQIKDLFFEVDFTKTKRFDYPSKKVRQFILLNSAEKNVYLISRYLVRNFPKFLEKKIKKIKN